MAGKSVKGARTAAWRSQRRSAAGPAEKRKADPVKELKRLSSADRRDQILQGAIAFFSDEGFSGSTRMLAKRLGIAQPLIYRYFPTKDDLIERVYEAVFAGRWRREWEGIVSNRAVPLRERIRDFYLNYTAVVFGREWVRIYLNAGLRGLEINRRWSAFVEQNVLRLVCDELRHEYGMPPVGARAMSPQELEMLWSFQGTLFYFAIRRDIYRSKVHLAFPEYLDLSIDGLLSNASHLMSRIAAPTGKRAAGARNAARPSAARRAR